jgi:hypothetical protein
MYIIAIIWLLFSFPIALEVDREMKKTDNPLRYNIIVNIMMFFKIIITTPLYYVLWIASKFTSKK